MKMNAYAAIRRAGIRSVHTRMLALGLLTASGIAAATEAGAPPSEAAPEGAVVQIVDFMRFEPTALTVSPGTTVTWVNHDGSNHIIELKADGKSPRLRHGASWSHRFTTPGEFPYICAIHGARMSGTIIVQAP